MTLTDSTFSGNSLTATGTSGYCFGGGLLNSGTITLSGSTIAGNSATATNVAAATNDFTADWQGDCVGGGLYNSGTMTLSGSTFSDNGATATAGDGEGGGVWNGGTMTLSGSTFSGNSAKGTGTNGGGNGGGVWNGGTMTLTGSTFSGNSATGTNGLGGGVSNTRKLTLSANTIAENTATGMTARGGGLYIGSTYFPTILLDTLIVGNTANDAVTSQPDVAGFVAAPSAYNLIGDGSGMTGLVNGTRGNQVGTSSTPLNARLAPLEANGGPTDTAALFPGSPAINAGGALTRLSQAVSAGTTTIPVQLASAIIARGTTTSLLIQVDAELLLVTGSDGSKLTVQRGQFGTLPGRHLLGAKVFLATDQTGNLHAQTPDIGAFEYQPVTTTVTPLADSQGAPTFPVTWMRTPVTSGLPIATYTVYVSDNNGPFKVWQSKTTDESAMYPGVAGHTYSFFSVATDVGGNVQSRPLVPQAATKVITPQLVIITPPANVKAGVGFGLTVAGLDEQGQEVDSLAPALMVAVTVASSPVGGPAVGTKLTAMATVTGGEVALSKLMLTKLGSYTLTISGTGLNSVTTAPFTVAAGVAKKLLSASVPATTVAGAPFALTVTAQDAFGNPTNNLPAGSVLSVKVATGPAGTVGLPVPYGVVPSVNGVYTLSGMSQTKAGSYTLSVSAAGVTSATTNNISVTAAAATRLVLTTPPPTQVIAGTAFSMVLTAQDQFGNTDTAFATPVNVTVLRTVTLDTGTVSIFPDNFSATPTVNINKGVVTIAGMKFNSTGTTATSTSRYSLTIASGALPSLLPNPITVIPAAATKLAAAPVPPIVPLNGPLLVMLTAQDQFGNLATNYTSLVSAVTIATGPAGATRTLLTPLPQFSNGQAVVNVSVNKPTTPATLYSLKITSGTLSVTTGTFSAL